MPRRRNANMLTMSKPDGSVAPVIKSAWDNYWSKREGFSLVEEGAEEASDAKPKQQTKAKGSQDAPKE